jgi:hypothetical protein
MARAPLAPALVFLRLRRRSGRGCGARDNNVFFEHFDRRRVSEPFPGLIRSVLEGNAFHQTVQSFDDPTVESAASPFIDVANQEVDFEDVARAIQIPFVERLVGRRLVMRPKARIRS